MTEKEGQIKPTEILGKKKEIEAIAKVEEKIKESGALKITAPGVIDNLWLEGRSEDELLDLIVMASQELKKKKKLTTEKIAKAEDPISFREFSEDPPSDFTAVPAGTELKPDSDSKAWFIVLISHDSNHKPLALKIMGDIIFGRAAEDVKPDIDLTEFDGEKNGISREHAKIRVTPEHLELADLGSTNGTFFSEEKLALGKTAVLTDKSVITFGKLHFKVGIVRRPGE